MKRPSIYAKMKVLGAIDIAPGTTRDARIKHVAAMTFTDEEGKPHQFTWRTIQTWYYRYKNYGITSMENPSRSDKGRTRKVTPEEVLEAINAALPHFHGKIPNKTAIYRLCIEKGLFFEENVDSMVKAIRSAFYKRGLPEQLLVDNGSIYCCQEITLICARVGCILRHTAVRDAAAKGKIERFFRRVRDQFLIRNLDLSSIESLNKQFSSWVEPIRQNAGHGDR